MVWYNTIVGRRREGEEERRYEHTPCCEGSYGTMIVSHTTFIFAHTTFIFALTQLLSSLTQLLSNGEDLKVV